MTRFSSNSSAATRGDPIICNRGRALDRPRKRYYIVSSFININAAGRSDVSLEFWCILKYVSLLINISIYRSWYILIKTLLFVLIFLKDLSCDYTEYATFSWLNVLFFDVWRAFKHLRLNDNYRFLRSQY